MRFVFLVGLNQNEITEINIEARFSSNWSTKCKKEYKEWLNFVFQIMTDSSYIKMNTCHEECCSLNNDMHLKFTGGRQSTQSGKNRDLFSMLQIKGILHEIIRMRR